MLKNAAWIFLFACAVLCGVASAEEWPPQPEPQALTIDTPQALTDAELDAIAAGGVTVIVSNPGRANVFNTEASHIICINCGGLSDKTNGIVITPQGKFIVIPGGPLK